MKIEDVIAPEDVLIDVGASGKIRLLKDLSQHAASRTATPVTAIVGALAAREKLGSTGLGSGIALPHAGVSGLTRPFGMFARLTRPCEFEAVDDEPVDLLCMLLVPEAMRSEHVNVLSRIARRLGDRQVTANMRQASGHRELYELLILGQGVQAN
jgi:nitrogen PTS system EIIA component